MCHGDNGIIKIGEKLMRNLIPSRDQFFRPLEEVVNKFYDGIMTDKNVIPFLKSRGGYPRLDILDRKSVV